MGGWHRHSPYVAGRMSRMREKTRRKTHLFWENDVDARKDVEGRKRRLGRKRRFATRREGNTTHSEGNTTHSEGSTLLVPAHRQIRKRVVVEQTRH